MNSFALWFNADEINKIDLEADVHFNLWNLHDKLSGPPCLDVGIKIKKCKYAMRLTSIFLLQLTKII
ncbi:hypothetical protein [uncultured Phascolarctobacterium sp.]|uniref:hypothetical protein n=1 Tax=uncultured Phascolarctobacterium sp. TaxID=512296 RepID=UPI00258EA8DB|nr:hypothetical protein [uncultured Phascolarctobacterium sp.]